MAEVYTLLSAVTATGASSSLETAGAPSIQVHVFSATTSSATVTIQLSVDGSNWYTAATITNPTSAGEIYIGPASNYVRANVTARSSGTLSAVCSMKKDVIDRWKKIDTANAAITVSGTDVTTTSTASPTWLTYSWVLADVTGLGASLTGELNAFSIPAKTVIENAYIVITTQGAHGSTLTVSLGRTATDYIDLIVASDAKAAANTVYGDAGADRGTLLGFDMPSFTGNTTIKLQFVSGSGNLSTVTGTAGTVYLKTTLLP